MRAGDTIMTASSFANADDATVEAAPAARAAGRTLDFVTHARGIAIAIIVLGHCFALSWGTYQGEPSELDLLFNMITGGTALFVFISGLIFHHVFYRRFDYGPFMANKAQRVFLPYVIITTFLFASMALHDELPFGDLPSAGHYINYVVLVATGQAGLSLWYIPFIALIFVLSPVFVRFIEARPRTQLGWLAASFLVGLLVNRSPQGTDPVQCVLYFGFYYLLGIYASIHLSAFAQFASRRSVLICCAAAWMALSQIQIEQGHLGNYTGGYFEKTGFNYMYPQKVALIVLLFGLLIRFRDALGASAAGHALERLAAASFPIFFLHNVVIAVYGNVFGDGALDLGAKYLTLAFWFAVVLGSTYLLTLWLKRLLKDKSTYVIGG